MPVTAAEPAIHLVQSYSADGDLVPAVARYLAEAVRGSGTAVVVAEAGHRELISDALADRAVDVAAARRDGTLVEADAALTLAAFDDGRHLDAERFDRVVGDAVRGAAARGGPVRAYGEMVSLLWARGDHAGAVELESLWKTLGAGASFSLYCSYRLPGTTAAPHTPAAVCQVHDAVLEPSDTAALPDPACDVIQFYDPLLDSPAATRNLIRKVLKSWNEAGVLDEVVSVASELAANAVQHARTGFAVTVSRVPGAVRVAVSDSDARAPAPRPLTPHAPSGRGLHLVRLLSRRWDVASGRSGKTVWAEVPTGCCGGGAR